MDDDPDLPQSADEQDVLSFAAQYTRAVGLMPGSSLFSRLREPPWVRRERIQRLVLSMGHVPISMRRPIEEQRAHERWERERWERSQRFIRMLQRFEQQAKQAAKGSSNVVSLTDARRKKLLPGS